MIPREILKKVKKIEIYTTRLVNDVLAGEYQSVFKGRGMEFSEVREYQPGDDIRTIDWNVTARIGSPYVKKFMEERELTVILLVDASASGEFGTYSQMKGEIAVEICALLAFSAIKNNDRVGLIIFTDKVEKYIPPKKGRKHVLRVIRELLFFKPQAVNTDLNVALEFLNSVQKRKAVVFLVSDFMTTGYDRALRLSFIHHDIIPISITDPRELELPPMGFIELEDAETGETVLVDTSIRSIRSLFSKKATGHIEQREEMFKSIGIDAINVSTDKPYIDPIVKFFRLRASRLR